MKKVMATAAAVLLAGGVATVGAQPANAAGCTANQYHYFNAGEQRMYVQYGLVCANVQKKVSVTGMSYRNAYETCIRSATRYNARDVWTAPCPVYDPSGSDYFEILTYGYVNDLYVDQDYRTFYH